MTAQAKCCVCGRLSPPRPAGITPSGWEKIVTGSQENVTYRCPDCVER